MVGYVFLLVASDALHDAATCVLLRAKTCPQDKRCISLAGPDGTKIGTDFQVVFAAVVDGDTNVAAIAVPQDGAASCASRQSDVDAPAVSIEDALPPAASCSRCSETPSHSEWRALLFPKVSPGPCVRLTRGLRHVWVRICCGCVEPRRLPSGLSETEA